MEEHEVEPEFIPEVEQLRVLDGGERAIVTAARLLLSDPARWTRCTPARNEQGLSVKPTAWNACCWCVVGAIARVSPEGLAPYNVLKVLDQKIYDFFPDLPRGHYNFEWVHDGHFDHETMLRFLNYVITS